MFVDIDGNVPDSKIGIGTSSPTETLHVVGDFRLTARFYDGSNSPGLSGRVLMSTGNATSWTNTFTTQMTFNSGVQFNAGIKDYTGSKGTAGQVLSSTGSNNFDIEWVSLSEIQGVDGSGTANYIPIWTDSDTLGNSAVYQSNSNIGIGTLSPGSYKLNVFGDFKLDSNGSGYIQSDYGDHRISIYDSNNNQVVAFQDLDGSSANQLVVSSSGVGIGIASPAVKLHVDGFTRINGSIQLDGNNRKILAIDNSNLIFGTNNVEKMRITSAGRLGIGTTAPETLLHVAGDITVDDNDKIQPGDSSDLQIYHDATNNYIDSVVGDLYLRFNTVAALGKQLHIKYVGNSDALVIKSTAQLELSQYGSGTFTGTATYRLAVDSSGNVIEIPIGSGAVDGSGAANKIAIWSDADTLTSDTNLHWDSTNDRLGVSLVILVTQYIYLIAVT